MTYFAIMRKDLEANRIIEHFLHLQKAQSLDETRLIREEAALEYALDNAEVIEDSEARLTFQNYDELDKLLSEFSIFILSRARQFSSSSRSFGGKKNPYLSDFVFASLLFASSNRVFHRLRQLDCFESWLGDPKVANLEGHNFFTYAIAQENIEVVRLLMPTTYLANGRNDYPLGIAVVYNDRLEIAMLLLEHFGRTILVTESGNKIIARKPLETAITHNKLKHIKLLLASGALEFDRDENRPALFGAESVKVAALLIRYGASPHRLDSEGCNVLSTYRVKSPQLIEYYVKTHGVSINHQNHKGLTALHYKIMSAYEFQAVEALLMLGADWRICDRNGNAAMHIAVMHNNPMALDLILKRGLR